MMSKRVQWLTDDEWARIELLLPRSRKGAHRVDDRRVISGIVHMLKSGPRWRDYPAEFGRYATVYNPTTGADRESGSASSHYDLGYIDLEQRTLQTLDNPFGPRLSPMS
jgi:transposase